MYYYQSEGGGTPNGVMKLPGRVMAGGVVPAGGFCFWFCFLVFGAPTRPGPSRTRDPPATHPRKKTMFFFHKIGLHKPQFDETWYNHNYVTRRITACYSRYNDSFQNKVFNKKHIHKYLQ